MDLDSHIKLFSRIAPVYRWFFSLQVKYYRKIIIENRLKTVIRPGATILDIGCGTGALSYTFKEMGYEVTALDISYPMARQASKAGLACVVGNAASEMPFRDKSFDYITGAFMVHGLDHSLRKGVYKESSRVARERVIYHDFNSRRHPLTDFIEWVEGGDYFNFIQVAGKEMENAFSHAEVINVAPRNAWYVCTP